MGNGAIYTAGVIFGMMALLHLARIFCPIYVQLGSFIIPQFFSYIGFILFGLLSIFLFRQRHILPKIEKV